jgi:hypothetical protein
MIKLNKMNKETLRMQMLAGLITESEYKGGLNEIIQDENFSERLKELEDLSLDYVNAYGKTKINYE